MELRRENGGREGGKTDLYVQFIMLSECTDIKQQWAKRHLRFCCCCGSRIQHFPSSNSKISCDSANDTTATYAYFISMAKDKEYHSQHGYNVNKDGASPVPPIVQKWSQSISDMSAVILYWWCHLDQEFVRYWTKSRATVLSSHSNFEFLSSASTDHKNDILKKKTHSVLKGCADFVLCCE